MPNLRIVSDNAADRSSLSASSVAGSLAAANLLTDKKSDVWRATGVRAALRAAWSAAEQVQCVATPFCNLSPTATMRVRVTNEAPATNLLPFSENIAAWVTNGDTGTLANYGIAPDGLGTSTFINSGTRYRTVAVTSGATYTYSYFVKLISGTAAQLFVNGVTPSLVAIFTFSTKAFTSVSSGVTVQYVDAGGGWFRIAMTFVATGASLSVHAFPVSGTAIEAWGGMLEAGTLTSYYPSLQTLASRATVGTYIDANGLVASAAVNVARNQYQYPSLSTVTAKLLVEPAATNLILYSELISNAAHAKSGSSVGAAMTAPDGTSTGLQLADTTNNSLHYVSQSIALTAGVTYSYSVFVKPIGIGRVQLYGSSLGSFANFNLLTGTVVSTGGGGYVGSSITAVGNGYYRISLTFTPTSTSTQLMYLLLADANGSTTYSGSGLTAVPWGFQLEVGRVPTSYIVTTSATVARAADVLNTSGAGTRPLGYMDWWQSYTYDSGAILCCGAPARVPRGWTAAQAASAYAYGGGAHAVHWLPSQVTAMTLMVDIVDTGNLQGYIEAARLVVGPYWSPAQNPASVDVETVDTAVDYRTEAGDQMVDAGPVYRKLMVEMRAMSAADRVSASNLIGGSRAYPVFLSVFPESPDLALERDYTAYGRRAAGSNIDIQNSVTYGIAIPIEEI